MTRAVFVAASLALAYAKPSPDAVQSYRGLSRQQRDIEHALPSHHTCIHDERASQVPPIVFNYTPKDPRRSAEHGSPLQRDEVNVEAGGDWEPLRIGKDYTFLGHPEYSCLQAGQVLVDTTDNNRQYTCGQDDVLTPEKIKFLRESLVPEAFEFFEKTLKVRRFNGFKQLDDTTQSLCGLPVPELVQKDNPDIDLVVLVTSFPTPENSIAWAITCALGGPHKRPIVGRLNIGPQSLKEEAPARRTNKIATLRHELTHVLGFSAGLYKDYVDANGQAKGQTATVSIDPITGTSNVISPKVVDALRRHLNCPKASGAPLEDYGGNGSAGSHWEKRVFRDEYMCATLTYLDPRYTEITLALLEDSGWYLPDYSRAETLPWGRGSGCGLLEGNCGQDMPDLFCSKPQQAGCSYDGIHKAYCNLKRHDTALPQAYRHFSDPNMGGDDDFMDNCPIMKAFTNGDCRDLANENAQSKLALAEVYSDDSRCFVSDLLNTAYDTDAATRCFKHKCVFDQSNGGFNLYLQPLGYADWLLCPVKGGVVKVPEYTWNKETYAGTVTCPASQVVCTQSQDASLAQGKWQIQWLNGQKTLLTLQRSEDEADYDIVDLDQPIGKFSNGTLPGHRKLQLARGDAITVKSVANGMPTINGTIVDGGKKIVWESGNEWQHII